MTIHVKKGKMEFKEEAQNRWLSPSDFLCKCMQIFFVFINKIKRLQTAAVNDASRSQRTEPQLEATCVSRWLLASSRKGVPPLVSDSRSIFSQVPFSFFRGLFCITRDLWKPCLLIRSPFEINRQHHTRSWLNLTKIEPSSFCYPGLSTCTHAAVTLIDLTSVWHLGA